jgi:trimethylguanosine synthase
VTQASGRAAATRRRVCIEPLPPWLDHARLLVPGAFTLAARSDGDVRLEGELDLELAADLAARLRGLGIGGRATELRVEPALPRRSVRAARLIEARRRRETSAGFTHPNARVDAEGRIALTPEALACALAERVRGQRVVDATAGVGGNAIAFARAGCEVTAIELDGPRLALARHNARVYGVAQRITFLHGDARALVPSLGAQLLFIDPPWGTAYDRRYTRADDLPLLGALLASRARFERCWIKLPPSFDARSLPGEVRAVEAVFGEAAGDYRRIKFLLVDT